MRTTTYGERDAAFGQAMLTLRTAIGLTRGELANHLCVSRQTVEKWETGRSYPKAQHLKEAIVLAFQRQAFPVGHEAEEIRALWKVAHQKAYLDEYWLFALLSQRQSSHFHAVPSQEQAVRDKGQTHGTVPIPLIPRAPVEEIAPVRVHSAPEPWVDWGDTQ